MRTPSADQDLADLVRGLGEFSKQRLPSDPPEPVLRIGIIRLAAMHDGMPVVAQLIFSAAFDRLRLLVRPPRVEADDSAPLVRRRSGRVRLRLLRAGHDLPGGHVRDQRPRSLRRRRASFWWERSPLQGGGKRAKAA